METRSLDFDTGRNWKRGETSRQAAADAAETAGELRARALAVIQHGPATADEVAQVLGKSVLSIRPRCSELVKLGAIRDSGQRRKNASGKSAIVWQAN